MVGIAGMLFVKEDGLLKLVRKSRKLSDTERNYHSTKLEQLAVVWNVFDTICTERWSLG